MKTQAAIPILAVFSPRSLIVMLTYSQVRDKEPNVFKYEHKSKNHEMAYVYILWHA